MNKISVAIVAFEGISSFHLSIPCAVFKDAFYDCESPFDVKVCAVQTGRFNAASCFGLYIEHTFDVITEADLVIVPSWDTAEQVPSALIEKLIQAHQRGAMIAGLCVGAYVLAASGLLDGKTATTHWGYADDFQQRFPNVELDPQPLYLVQDKLITSAGTAAALDCCLHILRQFVGAQVASDVSRALVAAPYRSGGQQQYIALPLPQKASDDRISQMMSKVLASLAQEHSIDSVAADCAMSRRHFSRVFKQLVGSSFGAWLTTARVKYAQELLEFSGLSIERITEQSGFRSQENFRKQFKTVFGVSPSRWRSNFTKSSVAQ